MKTDICIGPDIPTTIAPMLQFFQAEKQKSVHAIGLTDLQLLLLILQFL